jgi:hypothetical protein
MPSFDEVLLSEANAMRAEGLDPTEGAFTPLMPRVMDNRLPNSFVDNIYDSISVQPFWLLTKEVLDSNYPSEPGYDSLAPEEIKGYEFYASYLREARSRAHAAAIKRRIDTIAETKKRLEEDSGIAEGLIAEFANPINYLPLGAVRTGVGFARGAVRGAGAFAPVVLAEEGLRSQVDPTATREELLTNVATGVVLGGLIGGGIGVIGGNTGLARVAKEYDTFQRAMDGAPVPTRDVPVEPGAFVAEPTNVPTGVAPAFGLERITNRVTGYRRLISYNIRALEDLANGMVGEFDLMFNRNKVGPDGTAPLPTQRSAWLESGMWRGMAADTLKKLDAIYNEYLGGGAAPTTIANVNIPVTMQRVGQAFGMRPSDGKMTYNDFMDAIFRAHKQDGVKADDPFVGKAATVVREFFDKARDEGVKTGFLFNQRFAAGAFSKYSQRAARFQGEIEKLQAKDTLTDKERVKLGLLVQSFANAQSNARRYSLAKMSEQRQTLGAAAAPRTRVDMTPANDGIMPRRAEAAGIGQPSAANQILQRFVNTDTQFNPANDGRIVIDAFADNRSLEEAALLYKTGKPFVADSFHGTTYIFDRFDPAFLGQTTYAASAKEAFFSARSTKTAEYYANIDNPDLNTIDQDIKMTLQQSIGKSPLAFAVHAKDLASEFPIFFKNADAESTFWRMTADAQKYEDLYEYITFREMNPEEGPLPEAFSKKYFSNNRLIPEFESDVFNGTFDPEGDQMLIDMRNTMLDIRQSVNRFDINSIEGVEVDEIPLPESNIHMLRIRMDNPLVHDYQGEKYRDISYLDLIKKAKEGGHDGVVMLNTYDGGGKDIIYAVFDPEKMRARFDVEAYEATRRTARIGQSRPLNMPDPANDQDVGVTQTTAALRGAGGFERPRFGGAANENIPGYRGPANDPFYLPRQYDYEKIAADESGPKVLRSILTKYYTENPLPGLSVTDENVAKRVDSTIKTILGEAQTGELQVGKGSFAQFRMERSLDIPNELVADFLETDVSKLLRSYANRAGYGIELTRKFGSRDMQDAIDDTLLQAIDELDGDYGRLTKTINEMRDEITTLRDLATGDAYASNPASLSRKAVQALTGWAAITQMGGSAITALTEVAKPIMVHGIQRNLNFVLGRLADPEMYKNLKEEARVLTGEGLEVTLNMHAHRFTEQGGLTAPGITKIGRAFDKATQPLISFSQGPYYIANLLGPVTDMMKTYSGAMSAHFMLEDILKVAAGKASSKTVEKLASYGISVDAAKRMADQPIEKLTKLRVANTSAWDDPDLVRQFVGAVAGETRRTIVTAGPANKPNISQGFIGKGDSLREVALLRLPFQYMNFGFAAMNKNLLSALQGREANAFAGVAAMVGMGYMVARLKSSDAAWERMPDEEKILRAVNLSGILGIIGDVPNMIENASSGEYGLRPMLGLPPAYGYRMYDEYSSLGPLVGPGGGKIVDMYKLFVDDSTTEPEQARILRRMIPLNDAFYWKSLFMEAERGLTETLY